MTPTRVVAVSTLAIGLGSIPGFLFGFLAPVLQQDLDLTRWQIGVLVGAFFGATGLGSTAGGRLAERLGPRRSVVLNLLMTAAALMLPVLIPTYAALLAAAVVGGLGYALSNAGTNLAVASVLSTRRHGIALAVKTAGVPAFVAVNSLVSAGLAERVGWQPVLAGAVPLMLAGAGLAALVLPGAAPSRGSPPAAAAAGAAAAAVALPAGFLWFPLAAFLLVAGSQALFSWTVPYLNEAGGVPLAGAGALTASGSIVGVVVMITVAWRSDRAAGPTRLPAVVALCLATAAGHVLLLAGLAGGPAVMTAGLVLGTAAQLAAISLMHAAVVAAAPAHVGRATGVTMSGYYLGALVGAPLFGLAVDLTGSYLPGWGLCLALVVGAAACFWRCRLVGPATTASARTASARGRHADGSAAVPPG
jgi:predicted MFS family arabinose efflux permease